MKTSKLVDSLEIYHHIQPIIDLKTNRVYGYEFLLRSPQSSNPEWLFSEVKEKNLLFQLDVKSILTILENTQLHSFKDGYLFINVYPSTLIEPFFLYKLMDVITLHHINPSSIVFELNESDKQEDLSLLRKCVDKYREKGFLISIDDFGKGEANMKTVLEIQPDIVKLDRYFSENLSVCLRKQKVIQFFIEMLDGEATVVLEGIESEEDLRVAKEIGVTFGQGYYYGRPNSLEYYEQIKEGTSNTIETGSLAMKVD